MLWLYLSNTVAIVGTFGLFAPFARIRVLRYVVDQFLVMQARRARSRWKPANRSAWAPRGCRGRRRVRPGDRHMNAVLCRFYDGRDFGAARRQAWRSRPTGSVVVAIDGSDSRRVHSTFRTSGFPAASPTRLVTSCCPMAPCLRGPRQPTLSTRCGLRAETRLGRRPAGASSDLLHRLDSTWRGRRGRPRGHGRDPATPSRNGARSAGRSPRRRSDAAGGGGRHRREPDDPDGSNSTSLDAFTKLDEQPAGNETSAPPSTEMKDHTRASTPIRIGFFYFSRSFGANAFRPAGRHRRPDRRVGPSWRRHDEEIIAVLAHELGHVAEPARPAARGRDDRPCSSSGPHSLAMCRLPHCRILGPDQLLVHAILARRRARSRSLRPRLSRLNAGISPTRLADILQRLEQAHGAAKRPACWSGRPAIRARRSAYAARQKRRKERAAPKSWNDRPAG